MNRRMKNLMRRLIDVRIAGIVNANKAMGYQINYMERQRMQRPKLTLG